MVQVVENNGLYLNATEKVYINGITIDGGRTTVSPNAKTLIDCKDLVIKNAEVKNGCVAYNIIEQPQNAKFPTESIYIDNLKAPNTIIHNVVSYYNFADNAEILIENAEFDLNVATSNVIRLSNYTNVDNVTVTLRNVKWTYETVGGSEEDF